MKKICIIGSSGFAKEVYWLIKDCNLESEVDCFMEPDQYWKEGEVLGLKVRKQSEFDPALHMAVLGIGDSKIREKVVTSQLPKETEYPSIIHPNVKISPWVKMGRGAIISAGSIITCDINIGEFATVNLNCTIGHDCNIGDYMTLNPGVNLSGLCNLGHHVYIGTNAAIRQGVSICDNVTIGMGATVVKNIVEAGVYIGSPSKKM